jgi:hypothetical protein
MNVFNFNDGGYFKSYFKAPLGYLPLWLTKPITLHFYVSNYRSYEPYFVHQKYNFYPLTKHGSLPAMPFLIGLS